MYRYKVLIHGAEHGRLGFYRTLVFSAPARELAETLAIEHCSADVVLRFGEAAISAANVAVESVEATEEPEEKQGFVWYKES
jgi:hypothetical protein